MLVTDVNGLRFFAWDGSKGPPPLDTKRHMHSAFGYAVMPSGHVYVCAREIRWIGHPQVWQSSIYSSERQLVATGYREVPTLADIPAVACANPAMVHTVPSNLYEQLQQLSKGQHNARV